MTTYGYQSRKPEVDYFAEITFQDGTKTSEHFKTNLGFKVAYGMIAKRYAGLGELKIKVRDISTARAEIEDAYARGSDAKISVPNIWAGYSSAGESYSAAR